MANGEQTTEVVFIDFKTDLSDLQTATEILQKTGQIDQKTADSFKKSNAEIQKRTQIVNNAAKATATASKQTVVSIEEVHAIVNKMLQDFIEGMALGVKDALEEAGFEFDEFGQIIQKGGKAIKKETNVLKAELGDINRRLAEMKLRGEENTQEFIDLAKRGGQLKDAIADAGKEVTRFASDTKNIDGLIDLATGVAGAFSVAQGAAALFGEEGDALQETLLKVNSAMAILQGLQATVNLIQKDSAAITTLNAAAQQGYNFVIGESIGLLKAFRIALALTGIGAVIIGLTLLVQWLNKSNKEIEANTKALQKLSAEMEHDTDVLDEYVGEIQRASEERTAALRAQGATQKEIRAEQLKALKEEQNGVFELEQSYRSQAAAAEETLRQVALGNRKFTQEEVDAAEAVVNFFKQITQRRKELSSQLRIQSIADAQETKKEELEAIADGLEARLASARKNSAQELALAKQAARARADIELLEAGQNAEQVALIRANLNKKIRELDLEFQRVRQQDRIAGLEAQLAAEQKVSRDASERIGQDEIDIQKKLIQEKARLDLMQEGLTANQRLSIIQQSLAAQAELQRDFNQTVSRETLEDLISRNNAQLQLVSLSNDERLRLTEENIIAQAEIEIEAAHGLSDKIKEIEAKRNADLLAARRAAIEQQLQYDLDLATAREGVLRRTQERILSNERSTYKQRVAAINQLAALDIEAINKKQDALEDQLKQGLISQQDYNLRYAQLLDEELAATAQAEQAKSDLRRRHDSQRIAIALDVTRQLLDIVEQAGQQELEHQQQIIDAQRQEVQDLLDTGAITEKEAERRQKKLDLEERRLKQQQAKREKEFATFKAILAIPQAYLQGLVQGGPILGAIYAALAAAQAILIAAKQPPKFAVGKKHLYEGPAEIGHGGGELWQTDSGMYYAKKPTIVWTKRSDKVFSPTETQRMLEQPGLQATDYSNVTNNNGYSQTLSIDYERLGVEVGKNIPKVGFNIDADGVTAWASGKNSFSRYLGQRRNY